MSSNAYGDFATRLREPLLLIRDSLAAVDAVRATALSKGASVLAAAAVERYVNDVVIELCSKLAAATWEELTEGQQRYMARQLARSLYAPVRRIHRKGELTAKRRAKLRAVVAQCEAAFGSPAMWQHVPEYGVFMEGAAEPERVAATLRIFDGDGRSLFAFAAGRGLDSGALARALTSLIDARHQAAHANKGTVPGPTDVRIWILLSLVLVRQVEVFLGFR